MEILKQTFIVQEYPSSNCSSNFTRLEQLAKICAERICSTNTCTNFLEMCFCGYIACIILVVKINTP